jgi:hypothetical protein
MFSAIQFKTLPQDRKIPDLQQNRKSASCSSLPLAQAPRHNNSARAFQTIFQKEAGGASELLEQIQRLEQLACPEHLRETSPSLNRSNKLNG